MYSFYCYTVPFSVHLFFKYHLLSWYAYYHISHWNVLCFMNWRFSLFLSYKNACNLNCLKNMMILRILEIRPIMAEKRLIVVETRPFLSETCLRTFYRRNWTCFGHFIEEIGCFGEQRSISTSFRINRTNSISSYFFLMNILSSWNANFIIQL